MSTGEGSSYAPKSPDLSSFYSGSEVTATYTSPEFPQKSDTVASDRYPFQASPSLTYGQPQPHQYNTYRPPAPPAQPATAAPFSPYPAQAQGGGQQHQAQYYSPQQQTQFSISNQQTPYNPQLSSASPQPYYSSYPDATSSTSYQHILAQPSQFPTAQLHTAPGHPASTDPYSAMPPRKAAQAAKQSEIAESPVRTKFPTARIKRIMQADEEVGKVAQQTPIAVGKALELFMVQIVQKSAEVARERNSKRITAPMLKQAVESANEWDFLQDIVAKVNEEKEGAKGSGRAKQESESDDEADRGEVKKKGRGGRKKKAPA
ncbi:hypothetical protein F4779DRAFT_350436 [Xylariaceae sp. FL0662B]|nr:hypothetical protein F4779DRAFT_350436 [Xylariaceae sp. FL0662B]